MIMMGCSRKDPVPCLVPLSDHSVPLLKLGLGVSRVTLEHSVNIHFDQQCGPTDEAERAVIV